MATCLTMLGTNWPERSNAASGLHLLSTTCEQLAVLDGLEEIFRLLISVLIISEWCILLIFTDKMVKPVFRKPCPYYRWYMNACISSGWVRSMQSRLLPSSEWNGKERRPVKKSRGSCQLRSVNTTDSSACLRALYTPAVGYLPKCANVVRQLKKMEDSHQEATEKEVERILGYLKSYYQDDRMFKIIPLSVQIQ